GAVQGRRGARVRGRSAVVGIRRRVGGVRSGRQGRAAGEEARRAAACRRPDGGRRISRRGGQADADGRAGRQGRAAALGHLSDRAERRFWARGVRRGMAFMRRGAMDKPAEGEALQKELDAFFDKHKLKPPFAREPDDLFKGIDLNTYVSDALVFMKSKVKKGDDPLDSLPVPKGKLTDLKVTGDKATAQLNGKEINFAKISNGWFTTGK